MTGHRAIGHHGTEPKPHAAGISCCDAAALRLEMRQIAFIVVIFIATGCVHDRYAGLRRDDARARADAAVERFAAARTARGGRVEFLGLEMGRAPSGREAWVAEYRLIAPASTRDAPPGGAVLPRACVYIWESGVMLTAPGSRFERCT